jgi:UDP-N-acetylglucosamine--N-acetylmuramyl-(pentapeptide) pyrophosphoryl-undecaprenol N-acetylglucosamine transferase
MRIIIASSGTGGHLFCGLSIAEELKKRRPENKMFFLGSSHEIVRKAVEDRGFKFYRIYAAGLTGKSAIRILKFIFGQFFGILQSGLLLFHIRPDIVVSTGGFISTGIVLWSWLFRVPCVVHEQNIIPGKANKFAGRFADKILISFEDTKKYFKEEKCIFTGMPMRFNKKIPAEDARIELGLDPKLYTVLVMGGSRGAHRINTIVTETLIKITKDIQFIHLAGNEDVVFVQEEYRRLNFNSYVEAFSTSMDVVYSASDLVISRAGSGSLSEITFFGLPSILVPYPHSKDRHQYKNADSIASRGAAVVITEDKLSPAILESFINKTGRLQFQKMAKRSKEIAQPYAVEKIADEIMRVANA